MDDYRPIATAPRDGTLVEVYAEDAGSFVMKWNAYCSNPLVSDEPCGMWEAEDDSYTWYERDGYGPTHWRPYQPKTTVH